MSGIVNKKKYIVNNSTVQENEPININDVRENNTFKETPNISTRPLTNHFAQQTTGEVQATPEVLRLPVIDHTQIYDNNRTNAEIIERARIASHNRTTNAFSSRRNNQEDVKALEQARNEEFEQKLTNVDEKLEERNFNGDQFNDQTKEMTKAHTNTGETIRVAQEADASVSQTSFTTIRAIVNYIIENPFQVGVIGTIICGGAYWYFRSNNTETTGTQTIGQGLAASGAIGVGGLAAAAAGGSFSESKQENKGFINVNINKK